MALDNGGASPESKEPMALGDGEGQEIRIDARSLARMERIITINAIKYAHLGTRAARAVARCIVAEFAAIAAEQRRAALQARNQAVLQDWRAGMRREAICAKHKIGQSTFYRILKQRQAGMFRLRPPAQRKTPPLWMRRLHSERGWF